MELFIDTANLEDIKKAAELGVISGVTTNPTLIAKEGRNFRQVIMQITQIIDGPISAEVIGLTKEQMLEEARQLAAIHPNIVIKVPMIAEGLKAIKELSKEGIKTNCTLVFSVNQAILAARAGATYVSPFVGRLEDIGEDGVDLVAKMAHVFEIYDFETKIIAASIRNPQHVYRMAELGADIATIPYKVIEAMMHHHLTDKGVQQFLKDWETVKDK